MIDKDLNVKIVTPSIKPVKRTQTFNIILELMVSLLHFQDLLLNTYEQPMQYFPEIASFEIIKISDKYKNLS